jgi:hypothetical protein
MKAGRPRLEVDKELIPALRAEGWGYRRIAKAHSGKAGYLSASTVRNINKSFAVYAKDKVGDGD